MRSVVNCAMLALVRDKSSYGAEIGRRFVERYGGLLGSQSHHAHRSLRALERRGFIEPYRTTRGTNRQPRVHFRITPAGRAELDEWLRSPLLSKSEDQEMAVRLLSVRSGDAATMGCLLAVFKGAKVAAASKHQLPDESDESIQVWFRELERVETNAGIEWADWALARLGTAA